MNVDEYVKVHGLDLAEGENSGYIQCPVCKREGKFSITRTSTGLLYHCFRDSCPTAGHVSAEGVARRKEKHKPKQDNYPLRPYVKPIRDLHAWEYARFMARNGLSRAGIKSRGAFRWAVEDKCYVFPVFSPQGFERGIVLRRYDGKQPKASTRMHTEGPLISWHGDNPRDAERVVLVEDQVSAVKLSRWLPTVALLGTALSPEGALEIASMKVKHVSIALDEDATATARKLQHWYALMWPACDVVKLKKDVKDMSEREIQEVFGV